MSSKLKISFFKKSVLSVLLLTTSIFNLHCSSWSESFGQSKLEGAEFGKVTDQNGCMKESLLRSEEFGNFNLKEATKTRFFLQECLKTSSVVPGFCKDVPGKHSPFLKKWQKKNCRGEKNEVACRGIYDEKHGYCRFR